jgi:glycerophosphoryl diester phosphodiesterase
MGVDVVELGVQRTRDGHLILMHEKTPDSIEVKELLQCKSLIW